MSITSLGVVAVTKNIIINRAELSVEDSPIEFIGTDNFLIVNSVLTQNIVVKKTTNIPVDVDYFNYSSVNDEGLSGDITIKSEASISFGEDDIEEEPEIELKTVNLDTETEKTVLWGNIVKFTANAAQAASTVPYTITGITSEELNDAPLTGFMDFVNGAVEKEFLLTPKNNTTIEDFTFSIALNQQTTLSALVVIVRTTAPSLYSFTDVTFSPGSATESTGPTLVQAVAGLSGTGVDVWKNNTSYFNTSNGIQLWTVPADGTYRIEAWGAQGGLHISATNSPGLGARMRGDFELIKGEIIRIMVGQQGQANPSGSVRGSGGGGGSFVIRTPYNTNPSILAIAGGGGGADGSSGGGGISAVTSNNGTNNGTGTVAGGTNGNGGSASVGGGGGGFFGNGANATATGGASFTNGGNGGSGEAAGGFAGGGGGDNTAGGGGGYSGGASGARATNGDGGGGGGSFNSGTNQSNSAGVRTGDGSVQITLIENTTPPPTLGLSGPETATFGDTLTYQFLYSPNILANGTDLAYTITGIDPNIIVGNTLTGTIKVYDDASFLIIKLENIGITGTLTLTITLPDNSTETFSTEIVTSFINVTTSSTVISTTFNDAQPESAPILSRVFSKEIMIGLDEMTFSLIRIVPVNISISVREDQELGFFIDADGKAAFAVLDDSNDPRAIQVPGFGAGPVQRWF